MKILEKGTSPLNFSKVLKWFRDLLRPIKKTSSQEEVFF
jgi:hypothetical protein